jgi:transposase
MSNLTTFQTVNPNSAGIDIGSAKIFVSTNGVDVISYGTFTQDFRQCISDMKGRGVERVAMEATGVYWINLYSMFEEAGIRVCLVNPKEVRQVKGRKTDVKDCQWIQKKFAAGLLTESYVPEGKLKELRYLVRERLDIIEMGATYVNKMQRGLELMNIKLTNVIAQIQGASGIKMIEAILSGERDREKLLMLCDARIRKNKSKEVLLALEGNYNDTYLFILAQNLGLWKLHQNKLDVIDQKIQGLLEELCNGKSPVQDISAPKPARHHHPKIEDLHSSLVQICGANPTSISGLNDYTLLRLIGETGTDMERFPTVKHFVSWCQLSPGQNQTGKRKRRAKAGHGQKAGQIFRESAQALINSKYVAIGVFVRRLRARKGPQIAIKAGGRKIAEAYYNLLRFGTEYVEAGQEKYEQILKEKELKTIIVLAKKHNFQLIDIVNAA